METRRCLSCGQRTIALVCLFDACGYPVNAPSQPLSAGRHTIGCGKPVATDILAAQAPAAIAAFVRGFRHTAVDGRTILAVRGDVVTARLSAKHLDGMMHIHQRTRTVNNGVITQADVKQIS